MRCRDAEEHILMESLGALAGRRRQALADHARRCAACAAAWSGSRSLDRELQALQAAPVPALDVRRRVLEQLSDRRTGGRSRWFGWAAAAAVGAITGLGVLTVQLIPHALPLLRGAYHGGLALIRSAAPLATLGTALGKLAGVLARPVVLLAETWITLQPLTLAILAGGAGLALATALVIVGRSFLAEQPAMVRKES